MSEPEVQRVIEERDVMIPMRDGVCLAADIWRPDSSQPAPVLVSRTPYDKLQMRYVLSPSKLADAGFCVVVQDCRGRFASEGEWSYLPCEIDDGYDTVEWAGAQPWSSGKVGMFGPSYMGLTQWLAAIARPPHLVAVAPECCSADYWAGTYDSAGTFRLALRVGWATSVIAASLPEGDGDPVLGAIRDNLCTPPPRPTTREGFRRRKPPPRR
jgi:putative CocE/NonD family hydrolase